MFFRTNGFQLKLFILIESSFVGNNKKNQSGRGLRANLGQVKSNVVKKVKKQALWMFFFIFYMGNTF